MMLRKQQRRRGSVLIESALVYPVLFFSIFAILMLSQAVFHKQQVTYIAREAARWAAVHGSRYATDNGKTEATPTDVYDKSIRPNSVAMRPTDLTYTVSWTKDADGNDLKSQGYMAPGSTVTRQNVVTVTVTYLYRSGLFGTFNITSTSSMVMSY